MTSSPDCPTVCVECVREVPGKHDIETFESCKPCDGTGEKGGSAHLHEGPWFDYCTHCTGTGVVKRELDDIERDIEEFCDEVGKRELCPRHLARARAEAMES